MKAMHEHCTVRRRRAMDGLLKLTEMPPLETDAAVLEGIRAMRTTFLEGESAVIWAIEKDGNPDTRQALPGWIAKPIEHFVMNFSDAKARWDKLLFSRSSMGKPLTPLQQQKYDHFCKTSLERKFLFNKVEKTVVTKLRSNADKKVLSEKMFSLRVTVLGAEMEELQVKAGNGEEHKLLLLRGDPVECGEMPSSLDVGVDGAVVEALQSEKGIMGPDDEQAQGEQDADMLEEQAKIEAEQDLEEFCANTSEEEALDELKPDKSYIRVKSFDHRPAYVRLQKLGLTMLPTHKAGSGVFLSFHKTTNTWQGFYPGCAKQLSFTFGGLKGSALDIDCWLSGLYHELWQGAF